MPAPLPQDEEARLAELHRYAVLDTLPEPAFDDLTRLAAAICGTPISLVSLVDESRQWFKSSVGLEAQETPRDHAFCAHALLTPDQMFMVPDAVQDARFDANPLVTGDPHIRFYAGAPLISSSGRALGTLCAIDRVPRELTAEQRQSLEALARQVVGQLELRRELAERTRSQEALRESDLRKAAILEAALDAIITIDHQGRVLEFNPAAERIFGYARQEILGHEIADFIVPPAFREQHRSGLAHYLAAGEGPVLRQRMEIAALHREGHEFPIELTIVPVEGLAAPLFTAYIRDISARRQAEHALEQARAELERRVEERTAELAQANAALEAEVSERQRAQEQMQQQEQFLRSVVDSVPAMIFVKDWEGNFTLANQVFADVYGTSVENILGKRHCDFSDCPAEETERFLRDDRQVMASQQQKFIAEEAVSDSQGNVRWMQTVKRPLQNLHKQTPHVLGVATDISHRKLAEEQIRALNQELAERLRHINILHGNLQELHGELTHAYETTIEGWSRALDLRDKETEGHCRRVTEMTLRLARAFEISDEELVHIRRGALLHDIGKMGVPDGILLKPGPLTPEERDVMMQHTIYAYDLLASIDFLRPALDIPYYHHEKWDGTGYPRGLCGEEIPLAARLFAIVDVWDALRSDRPYRDGWPEDRVRSHIAGLSGTHFDPCVVEVFLHLLTDGAEEYHERKTAGTTSPEQLLQSTQQFQAAQAEGQSSQAPTVRQFKQAQQAQSAEPDQPSRQALVPVPNDEESRLAALRRYAILDTPPEDAYDDIASLAGQLCQTPFAAITFLDEQRQWFKSCVGLPTTEMPRSISFCTHAILQQDVFEVMDTQADPRFAQNPLVTGEPHLRFYAGIPLLSSEGQPLGTLCVADFIPRELDAAQRQALVALGRQVMQQLELRRHLRETAQELEARYEREQQIAAQLSQAQEHNAKMQNQQQQLAQANAYLAERASTDGLTGLKNHGCFQEALQTCLSFARRQNMPLSVLMVDVDSFKTYNDTYGHPAGDTILRIVASILKANARAEDMAARYGGEEFALLLLDADANEAQEIAERIRVEVEAYAWPLRPVTASFGAATLTLNTASAAHLVQQADEALYQAKSQGRNRVRHFSDIPGQLSYSMST